MNCMGSLPWQLSFSYGRALQAPVRKAWEKGQDIRGVLLFATSERESREIHAALQAGLENGTLRPLVAQKIPLAEAARAHEDVMKGGALGKIVLVA